MPTTERLSEKSHQGFDGIKAALYLGSMETKSNTASGMAVCLWRNGIRSRSSGKERDAETGLDFFGARYFSSPQGRFTSPDEPFTDQYQEHPQSWNLYAPITWSRDANGFLQGSATTIINTAFSDPEYWNYGDVNENADTILHELGHALRKLGFTGGEFVDNDKDKGVNATNSDLIRKKCL